MDAEAEKDEIRTRVWKNVNAAPTGAFNVSGTVRVGLEIVYVLIDIRNLLAAERGE